MTRLPGKQPTTPLRERESTGLNQALLALESRRALRPIVVMSGLVAIALIAAAIMLKNMNAKMPFSGYYTVQIAIDDAKGVVAPDQQEVRLAGVPVGKIAAARLIHGTPVLT